MDLKVSSTTFGSAARFASRPRIHQKNVIKTNFLNKVSEYASPAGWLLLLSFLIGSVAYYGIKQIRENNVQTQNSVENVTNITSQDTFTATQE